MATYEVVRNEENSRFEVQLEGHLAELEYVLRDGRIIFTHTGVPEPLEGRGIGSALARTGLEFARATRLAVVPACPFVKAYIERHSEYQELVTKKTADE